MDWTEVEVELIVADYFQMLERELKGIKYVKSDHNSHLQTLIKRNRGSIEFKHQNISAVLINKGLPYINGYKPRGNYQRLLEEKIIDYIIKNPSIEKVFYDFANRQIKINSSQLNYDNWNVTPPTSTNANEPEVHYDKAIKRNYLEMEQRNSSIGMAGEELVFDYEKWALKNAGFPKLASAISWVSQDRGDGLGYDILSKNIDGTDKFIEVKTTTQGKDAPIFFSKRENSFSEDMKDSYHLYRVFDLLKQPKMFNKKGSFKEICTFEPINFKGYF